jgi:SNW domain-containing protein 1
MASVASGLFKSLPKPKYTGEDEEIPSHAQQRGPRVLGAGALDESQIVLRVCISCLNKLYVYCDLLIIISL